MKPLNEKLVMTQEDKELLLKDLCARLPYEIKGIRIYKPEEVVTLNEIIPRCKMNPNIGNGLFCELGFDKIYDFCTITEFKPYLFPMSSMTDEEKEELKQEHRKDEMLYVECLTKAAKGDNSMRGKVITHYAMDWCNKNHFDYRGLIEKGLAIDATGLNIY